MSPFALSRTPQQCEAARIRFYAYALVTHRLPVEFILEALSDPAWPGDSREVRA